MSKAEVNPQGQPKDAKLRTILLPPDKEPRRLYERGGKNFYKHVPPKEDEVPTHVRLKRLGRSVLVTEDDGTAYVGKPLEYQHEIVVVELKKETKAHRLLEVLVPKKEDLSIEELHKMKKSGRITPLRKTEVTPNVPNTNEATVLHYDVMMAGYRNTEGSTPPALPQEKPHR